MFATPICTDHAIRRTKAGITQKHQQAMKETEARERITTLLQTIAGEAEKALAKIDAEEKKRLAGKAFDSRASWPHVTAISDLIADVKTEQRKFQ